MAACGLENLPVENGKKTWTREYFRGIRPLTLRFMKKSEARKQSNIDVSIVIPCYNEADGVRKSLEEIRKALRDTDGVQVIVVNDGSSDETPAILKDCARNSPNSRPSQRLQPRLWSLLEARDSGGEAKSS